MDVCVNPWKKVTIWQRETQIYQAPSFLRCTLFNHLDPSRYLIDQSLKWIYASLIFILFYLSLYVIYICHFFKYFLYMSVSITCLRWHELSHTRLESTSLLSVQLAYIHFKHGFIKHRKRSNLLRCTCFYRLDPSQYLIDLGLKWLYASFILFYFI